VPIDAVAVAVGDGELNLPEVAFGEFNDLAALFADEVMMVALTAQAVGRLAFMVADYVDESRLAECPERSIHRREPEFRTERFGHPMDLCGAERTRLVLQGFKDRGALGCPTKPPLAQPFNQSVRHGHYPDDSVAPMRAVCERTPNLSRDSPPEARAS
jgi:hypothetical protein